MPDKEHIAVKVDGLALPDANPRLEAGCATGFHRDQRYDVTLSDGRIIKIVISTAADRTAIYKFPRAADILRRANPWGTIVIEGDESRPILWGIIRFPEVAVWPSRDRLEPGIGRAVQAPLAKYLRGL